MLARVPSGTLVGIDAQVVDVQVDLSRGLPSFATVGLPEGAVRESKDRVKSALKNLGYPFPREKVTVNLAPADLKKTGAGFDLPIAIALLAAQGVVDLELASQAMMAGELGLDGGVRPIRGALAFAMAARSQGLKKLIVPWENALEASVVSEVEVWAVKNLRELVDALENKIPPPIFKAAPFQQPEDEDGLAPFDLAEVKGQEQAKRALIVAAAGGHNLLLIGPPGSGKTMLAQRLPSILPPLNFEEALETTKVYSAVGLASANQPLITRRPFRSPHHTISDAGLIGGGSFPRPGEVSLAHHGVLFLDELPEFKKSVLEVLRQPLEDGVVSIARAAHSLTFPARLMLVAAMNPCPCGYLGDSVKKCECRSGQVQAYRAKVSGPLMDRLDLHVEAPAVSFKDLANTQTGLTSAEARNLVKRTRDIQAKRFKSRRIFVNAQMSNRHLKEFAPLNPEVLSLLETAIDKLGLSARAYARIIKIARTIADLAEEKDISRVHLAEAISYRALDRQNKF